MEFSHGRVQAAAQEHSAAEADASPHVERILAHHPHDAAAADAFEEEVRAILDTDLPADQTEAAGEGPDEARSDAPEPDHGVLGPIDDADERA